MDKKQRADRTNVIEILEATAKQYGVRRKSPNANKALKIEDFDLNELTSGLANSITDELYRSYLPELREIHHYTIESGRDMTLGNNMEVQDISREIHQQLSKNLVDSISETIQRKTIEELEMQGTYFDLIEATHCVQIVRSILITMIALATIICLFSFTTLTILTNCLVGIILATVCLQYATLIKSFRIKRFFS